jgi:DNA polymerase-3 subunit beta
MIDASVDRSALADALAWVAKVVALTPAVPILGAVRMTFDDAGVTLCAFDYDTSHTAHVAGDVTDADEALVPALLARDMVAALKGDTVRFTRGDDDSVIAVAAGRSSYRLPVLPPEDYPDLPERPPAVGFVDAADLVRLSKATWWAVGRDDMIPALTAVEVVGDDDGLRMLGTNRFVMAKARLDGDIKQNFRALVSGRQLGTAVAGMSGRVEIGVADNLLALTTDDRAVTTRQLGVEFPRLERLFDTGTATTTAYVDVPDTVEALKRAQVALEKNNAAWLTFHPDHVAIAATSDVGKAADDIVDATVDGPSIRIGFNPTFLIDALLALGSDQAEIQLTGDARPAHITDTDTRDVHAVVMPRRAK